MSIQRGVILYGPPAAGKDTVTKKLLTLSSNYGHYRRMKVGGGRVSGYRNISHDELIDLRNRGKVIWENDRYGATYVVEYESIVALAAKSVPILHLGQVDAIAATRTATPEIVWTDVHLWCPRDIALQRIRDRGTGDVTVRLRAWDETPPLPQAALSINTSEVAAEKAARMIHARSMPV